MPKLIFEAEVDDPAEAAALILTTRTIRAGRDAWQAINKAESFDGWTTIGKALAVGRDYALKVTGANAPMGRLYSVAFSEWCRQHGFGLMPKSTRSVAIELAENAEAIEQWRSTLPAKQRRRLIHPLSNVRRWKASTRHTNGKCPMSLLDDARGQWRRFVSCVRLMPPEQADIIWKVVAAEAEAHTTPAYARIWS